MNLAAAVGDAARSAGARILDALLPPRCISCEAAVDGPGRLCPECWSRVQFIAKPWCAACGLPFDFDPGEGVLCGPCSAEAPAYDAARSVMVYDDGARDLILRFKHADRTDAAPTFGRWMARAGQDLLAGADWVVPVPLHRARLLWRRYNQSALLAHAVGRAAMVPVAPDALERVRNTPSQGGMSRSARATNVAGAFRVRHGAKAHIEGRRIVLIDDVMTTGATVQACARTLRKSGASHIGVLTLARVVRAADGAI